MQNKEDLKTRTQQFAIEIIKLVKIIPRNRIADIISAQLLRSGTSIGANYRAACRARSKADFISKMGIVEEEADETLYWLELLIESGITVKNQIQHLLNEGTEITAIVVASINTAKKNNNEKK
ncbi:MAG: four helix bundle protein [Candidatus Omnitrophota bacterium]|nr:four helix bundle protein [Candidatus Omnitrophota bacterium]